MTPQRTPPPRWAPNKPVAPTAAEKHAPSHSCACCDSQWTGLMACHCAECHRTFTGISAFDQHRIGSHAEGTRGCGDPTARNLVPVIKQYWSGWGMPGERPPR